MSLIEHLEGPNWQQILVGVCSTTLEVLEHDRFRTVGSSVDDLRAWMCRGGIPYARLRLDEQAKDRCFTDEHRTEIIAAFDEFVRQNLSTVLRLTASGVIPAPKGLTVRTDLPTAADVSECLSRLAAGERPFEDWMRAHGGSDADIATVYAIIDDWLTSQSRGSTLN